MKKLELQYGGGNQQCFIDMMSREIFWTSRSMPDGSSGIDQMVEKYGGEKYYKSHTELSAAGYLDFSKHPNTLKELGWYVIDQNCHDNIIEGMNIPFTRFNGPEIKRYERMYHAPTLYYEPMGKYMFITPWQWPYKRSENFPYEINYKTRYVNTIGDLVDYQWVVRSYYDQKTTKQFIREYKLLKYWQTCPDDILDITDDLNNFSRSENSFESSIYVLTKWIYVSRINKWVHYRRVGIEGILYPDDVSDLDPILNTKNGEYIPHSEWVRCNSDDEIVVVWKRDERKFVYLKAECHDDIQMFEYTHIVNEETFFNNIDSYVAEIVNNLLEKIKNYRHFVKDEIDKVSKIKKYLEEHPDKVWTIQHSLTAGNCETGTNRFIEIYKLTEPITSDQLIKHKKFSQFIQNPQFQQVILVEINK